MDTKYQHYLDNKYIGFCCLSVIDISLSGLDYL